MKLPSINYLATQAKSSALRYPMSLLSSLALVIIGIILVEKEKSITNHLPYINTILCCGLGISLFFCVEIIVSRHKLNLTKRVLLNTVGIVLLALLFLTFPTSDFHYTTNVPYIKFVIYSIAIHLLVSFSSFIKTSEINGFWQFNKALFIRFIVASIFSFFLYLGIILSLAALDTLFNIKINNNLYLEAFIVIQGLISTWIFLSGIPENSNTLDGDKSYPSGLKIFSQYIFLPLLALYILILYSYGVKIISLWDWPKGVVSYMITGVAVSGIFNMLLMFPYGNQEGNGWIKTVSRAYYFILIPLVVMLFIALSMRLNDYGITINRYLLFMMGAWLSLVSIYFIIGKTNIKIIPISLFITLTTASFGPWGIFSVSEKSQVNRLKHILENSNLLKNEKIVNEQTIKIDTNFRTITFNPQNQNQINDSLKAEIKSILDYLDDFHDFNSIKNWYSQQFDQQLTSYNEKKESWERINEAEIYMKAMGLDYIYYDATLDKSFTYSSNNSSAFTEIKGYDYEIPLYIYLFPDDKTIKEVFAQFTIDSSAYEVIVPSKQKSTLVVNRDSKPISTISLSTIQQNLEEKYGKVNKYDLPLSDMTIAGISGELEYKIIFENITFQTNQKSTKMMNCSGKLLFKLKQE